MDGTIYIQKLDEEFNLDTSLNDGRLAYIMDSKYSIDIKVIEYYLEKEKEIKNMRF